MSAPPQPDELQESKKQGHEVRDANVSRVAFYGLGMLVLVLLAGAVLSVVVYKNMGWFLGRNPPTPQFQAGSEQLPPLPRIEVQGWRDLREFRASEEKQLNSYGWVNREQNIVRIPIDRAMEITARRERR